jgi:polyphosphate kinase
MTCNQLLCSEVIEVFNYLTGSSLKTDYNELLIAPINMKSTFMHKIQQEIKNKKAGKPARIIAKMNSMEDEVITESLYEASMAGVEIILIVRGFCCLKPGIKKLSENIKVISIIGRFLEHSRVFYFANGSENIHESEFFIGSADWMHRNLHNRVELITPIYDNKLKDKLWEFIEVMLQDNRQAWVLNHDGSYTQMVPKDNDAEKGTHLQLMNKTVNKEKVVT